MAIIRGLVLRLSHTLTTIGSDFASKGIEAMVQDVAAPEDDFELPIAGFQGTPEEIERQWFEKVYTGRGDSMLQLTWRAVLMGSLLGASSR